MLLELKVSHFAVIDSLSVNFLRPGLNVLTGETGAGKSILLKSLGLLRGGKASPDVIRAGQEQAVIEGAFDLSFRPDVRETLKSLDLDSGDEMMIVRRIISASGKHRLYINGNLSTLNVLESIVPRLIEITSQHEHHSLTRPAQQLGLLDDFAKLNDLKKQYQVQFNLTKKLQTDIDSLSAAARDREQKLDFLKFQISELDAFNPVVGEDAELGNRYQRARFASRLLSYASKGEVALYSDEHAVHNILAELVREGDTLVQLDPRLRVSVDGLREAAVLVEDAAFSLRDYSKSESLDEEEMERLEERLSQLKKLQKKYGATIEDMIEFRNRAKTEFEQLEKHEENLKELQGQLKKAEAEARRMAEELHGKRVRAAKKLSEGINAELKDLNMKGVEFSVSVERLETHGVELRPSQEVSPESSMTLNSSGGDEVLFMIRSTPQDDPKPISKIASGGELSRLMLAIKQVVAINDKHMTYLFDEVDSGVSGPTAEKVGKKLKAIGGYHQVICITHLPQVAAFADAHFLITKEVSKGAVKSQVTELDQKARVQELGRMISGEKITAASLAHAKEMIEQHARPRPPQPRSPASH
jgi:DNA repair protein RecN (Recombination protein N)